MNFGTLKARIAAVIGRAPADVCYELVTADVNQELSLYQTETAATLTEAAVVDLPDDLQSVVSLYRDTDPRVALKATTPDAYQRVHQSSGTPTHYAIENDRLVLTPAPNGSENLVMRYLQKQADLSGDTDTNVVLTNYPSVYVYGVLTHHALLTRNEGLQAWAAAYEQAKKQAQKDSNQYRRGAGALTPIPPRSVA